MIRSATNTITGVNTSNILPLDPQHAPFNVGLYLDITGTETVDIEITKDNVLDAAGLAAVVWYKLTGATGLTASAALNLSTPCSAVRLNGTAGTGTAKLTVLQGVKG